MNSKHFQQTAAWARSILTAFDSATVESLARQTGFIQRKRKISAFNFFLALLCGLVPSAAPSLESICLGLQVFVSRQAVSKKFNKRAVAFMRACLELQLKRIASLTTSQAPQLSRFLRVIVVDSTQWALKPALRKWFQGYGGSAAKAACKLQTAFDFVSGKLLLLDFHRATRPDQGYGRNFLKLLLPGDLILMDLGYYAVPLLRKIQNRTSFFICPIYYNAAVKESTSRASSIVDLLQQSKQDTVDCQVQVGSVQKMQLRLVAIKNAPQKAEKLRRKVKEDYRKRGNTVPKKRLLFCDWTALVTNVDVSTLSASEVVKTYRCRWQIEIFFRDAKSHLNLDASPSAKRERFEVQLIAVLIVAALLCFVQGRFNQYGLQELSLEKLIKRFAQRSSLILHYLRTRCFKNLELIFFQILTNSIKFYQPSRKTPRQILVEVCLLS